MVADSPNIDILIALGCWNTTCRPSLQVWCKNSQQLENDKGNTLFQVRWFLQTWWINLLKMPCFCSKSNKSYHSIHEKDKSKLWEKKVRFCSAPYRRIWQGLKVNILHNFYFFLPFPPIIKPYINGCCFTIEPNIGILIVLGCRDTTCRPSLQVWCKNNQQVENDKGLTWNTLFWVRRFLHLFWPMWWVTSMMNFMTFAVKVKVGTIHFMKGTS